MENHGNVSRAMIDVGYDETTAKNPKNLTESKGFKELMDQMGLTDELLTSALIEDIEKKPQNRKAELELGFKLRGRLNEQQREGDKTLIVLVSTESGQRYASISRTSVNS